MAYLILHENDSGETGSGEHYFEFDPHDTEAVKKIEAALAIKKQYPHLTREKMGRIIQDTTRDKRLSSLS